MEDENVETYDAEYIYKSAKNVIFGLESELSNDMKVSKLIKLVDELPDPKDAKYLFSIFEDVIYIPVRNACIGPVIELDKDTIESLLIRLVDELIATKNVEYI